MAALRERLEELEEVKLGLDREAASLTGRRLELHIAKAEVDAQVAELRAERGRLSAGRSAGEELRHRRLRLESERKHLAVDKLKLDLESMRRQRPLELELRRMSQTEDRGGPEQYQLRLELAHLRFDLNMRSRAVRRGLFLVEHRQNLLTLETVRFYDHDPTSSEQKVEQSAKRLARFDVDTAYEELAYEIQVAELERLGKQWSVHGADKQALDEEMRLLRRQRQLLQQSRVTHLKLAEIDNFEQRWSRHLRSLGWTRESASAAEAEEIEEEIALLRKAMTEALRKLTRAAWRRRSHT